MSMDGDPAPPAPAAPPSEEARPPPPRSEWSRLAANLGGGLKALVWWRVPRADFDDAPAQLFWLVLANVLIEVAYWRLSIPGDADFYPGSLPTLGFGVIVALGLGLGFAGPHAPRDARLAPLMGVLCTTPWLYGVWIGLALWASRHGPPQSHPHAPGALAQLIGWIIAIYIVLAMLRVVATIAPRPRWRWSIAALGLCAMMMIPRLVNVPHAFYPHREEPREDDAEMAREEALRAVVSEELLDLQPRLIQQALAALKPQRPGVVDAYFVGFAPDAEQDVFVREIRSIGALMDQRFDTAGRSILLVNSADTMRTLPIASMVNLRRALTAVGQRMNPDEDVLILYLTSHGGRDGSLYSSMGPLDLTEVTPGSLRQAIADAHIGTRVIAVSACYAGTYLAPLSNASALVMTAADATHTSFGCSNEADFTYFGKAVFDEALRQTFSFPEAFARAVPVLRERETKVSHDFSNPQIAEGDQAKATLERLRLRLEARAKPPRAP